MIQYQVKLKLSKRQEGILAEWLWTLGGVYNWAIRKIELDASYNIRHSKFDLQALVNGHGAKIGVPQKAVYGTVATAHEAWQRCFKKTSRKPRLKGRRNKINSVAFSHGTNIKSSKLLVPCLGRIRYHKQDIPEGHIGQFRLIKRASGWHACLFIQAEPKAIPVVAGGRIGIDPGFKDLLSLSSGEKISHPRELEASALRLAQAQRGNNQKLAARIQERVSNQRKDRNHKLTRRLVSENVLIAFSRDNIRGLARRFGKSVTSSSHYQIRSMFGYKVNCRTDGLGIYVEPPSKNSTRTCSACGALSGPTGWTGLKVREWDCGACGAHHDRDTNAGMNALIAGVGATHERQAIAV